MISSTAATTPARNSYGSMPTARWTSPVSTSCQPGRPSALSCSIGMYSDSLTVVLGDPFGDRHLDGLAAADRLGGLDGPAQRAGEDGVDPLEGEVLGEVPSLVLVRPAESSGSAGPSKPSTRSREGVPDEQQLHRVSC